MQQGKGQKNKNRKNHGKNGVGLCSKKAEVNLTVLNLIFDDKIYFVLVPLIKKNVINNFGKDKLVQNK